MKCAPTKIRSSLPKAFTLLEMMMVMAIIAILVGGVIGLAGGFTKTAEIQQADTDIRTISSAVMSYKTLGGRYPTDEQGLQALVTKPSSTPKPRRWTQNLKKLPLDPWDNPYSYKMAGSKDSSTFEIISSGPDGKKGTEDDISSQDATQ